MMLEKLDNHKQEKESLSSTTEKKSTQNRLRLKCEPDAEIPSRKYRRKTT
jgi:hypothetical protein